MEILKGTVGTGAFSMDYCRFGAGAGRLLILPGLSVQSVTPQAEAIARSYQPLTEDYTIWVLDRRSQVPPVYSVKEMARDTAEAVRALGIEKVCVFGASQGGMIALEMAAACPELVQKLILGSTAARMTPERFRTVRHWIDLARAGNAERLYLSFGEAVYPRAVFEQARGQLTSAARTVTEEELKRFGIVAAGMRDFDAAEELKRISCPVLVIGARDDRVLGADASMEIAEAFRDRPDCELQLIDGYGHACYDTAPDYRERMLRFLRQPKGKA